MRGFIYTITHASSGRRYVGSTINVKKRWAVHRSDLNCERHHCRFLQRAWTKHGGDAFQFSVVETVESVADVPRREQHWLLASGKAFNTMLPIDSWRIFQHDAETRARMSAAALLRPKPTTETRARISAAGLGRKCPKSAEHRAKIAATMKGKPGPVISAAARARAADANRGKVRPQTVLQKAWRTRKANAALALAASGQLLLPIPVNIGA